MRLARVDAGRDPDELDWPEVRDGVRHTKNSLVNLLERVRKAVELSQTRLPESRPLAFFADLSTSCNRT